MAALKAYSNTITLDGFLSAHIFSADVEGPQDLTNACPDDGSEEAGEGCKAHHPNRFFHSFLFSPALLCSQMLFNTS